MNHFPINSKVRITLRTLKDQVATVSCYVPSKSGMWYKVTLDNGAFYVLSHKDLRACK